MPKQNIYQKLYKNEKEYVAAIKLDKKKYLAKIELEAKVEKEMKEALKDELYNNETFSLLVQKLVPILSQLPREPVLNKYLKPHFLRVHEMINRDDAIREWANE